MPSAARPTTVTAVSADDVAHRGDHRRVIVGNEAGRAGGSMRGDGASHVGAIGSWGRAPKGRCISP